MGLFDAWTGKSAKDAAAKNAMEYQRYGQQAQGYVDTAGKAADTSYSNAVASWQPLGALGQQYNQAGALGMDALGVNGADGTARAQSAFTASPGYQWSVDQATDAIARKNASLGIAGSGNTMAAISDRAGNMANQEYQRWLDNLKGYSDTGATATGAAAAGTAGTYGGWGNAQDARGLNRANIAGNVAGGIANSNTAAANAQMQASGQFWNGLMNLGSKALTMGMG